MQVLHYITHLNITIHVILMNIHIIYEYILVETFSHAYVYPYQYIITINS